MLLQINNLQKSYDQSGTKLEILKNLNLQIEPNSSTAILGKSGSGKSTLLSLLAGLDKADKGEILFKNKNLSQFNEAQLTEFRKSHLGIVFQNFHLVQSLTALENVQIALDIKAKKNSLKLAKDVLSRVGLENRFDHLPAKLSGGECQRVAIARAVVTEPEILLADEPSGNLDESTGSEVMQLLFNLVKSSSSSLILVTHNKELAENCDRVFTLHNGMLENAF